MRVTRSNGSERGRGALKLRCSMGSLALVAMLILLVGAPAAQASTQTVCASGCDYTSIQTAVAAATPGDTIQVAAGTYAENVAIAKSLVLEGAQAGVDARTRSGSESVLESVSISASDVTVDGFSFNSAGGGGQVDVSSPTTLSGIVVQNDIFEGYGTVALPTYDAGNILIQRNLFAHPLGEGEAMQIKASAVQGGCDGSRVLDNLFDAATTNEGADANFSCTGSNSSNVTVSGNETTGNSNDSSFTAFSGVNDGIVVTRNTGSTSGSSVFFFGNVSGSVLIDRNRLTGGGGSAVSIHGADFTSDTANTGVFTITNNVFTGNERGIYVAASALGTGVSVTAHFNDLAGNIVAGVQNASTSSIYVDATENWWGCNAGPGGSGCDAASAGVTFAPWLVLKVSASPSSVSTGGSSAVTADLTRNSAGTDTSGQGTILDGTNVGFATDFGSLSASSAGTSAGKAPVTLSSSSAGTAHVSATLDSQTVSTTATFTAPVPPASRPSTKITIVAAGTTTNGAGTITVMAPGPGKVKVSGKAIKTAHVTVSQTGQITITVHPIGKIKQHLDHQGKTRPKQILITFTAADGSQTTLKIVITFHKKHHK